MFYVYILQSYSSGKLYRGLTDNLRRRVKDHQRGKVTATKSGCPWKLVYYEAFFNKTDARKEEMFLKSGKGRDRIKYLLENTLRRVGRAA